jgi:hypothetical protein
MARQRVVEVSHAQRMKYLERADEIEDEIEELAEKKVKLSGILKDRIKMLKSERWALRRKAKGLDLEQSEVPGTETGESAPLDRAAAREIEDVIDAAKKAEQKGRK